MAENVEYKLILEGIDKINDQLKTVKHNADQLHSSFGGIKEILGGLGIAFGIREALSEMMSFGRESVQIFESVQKSKIQLDNALKNRDVGFTLEQLTKQAEEYGKKWIFSKEQMLAAQLTLTNFKNLHGQIFQQAEEIAINIASKRGMDVGEVVGSVGRALNDPTHGIRLLRQYGVVFTELQQKQIKVWEETGKTAKAQDLIMQQLTATFKGAADAAAQTDAGLKTLAKHSLEEAKEKFGEVIDKMELGLLPAFNKLIGGLDKLGSWLISQQKDSERAGLFSHFMDQVSEQNKIFRQGKTTDQMEEEANALALNFIKNKGVGNEGMTNAIGGFSMLGKSGQFAGGKKSTDKPAEANMSDKVTGTKQLIINVSIQRLNGIEKAIFGAGETERAGDMSAAAIVKKLLGAVNQFSASTDI